MSFGPVVVQDDRVLVDLDADFLEVDPDGTVYFLEDGIYVEVDPDGTVWLNAEVIDRSEWIDPAGRLVLLLSKIGEMIVTKDLASQLTLTKALPSRLRIKRRGAMIAYTRVRSGDVSLTKRLEGRIRVT